LTDKKPPPATAKVKTGQGVKDLYPWDEWFARARIKTVVLVRGKHFNSQVHGFLQTIRNAANRAGVKVSLTTQEDAVAMEVLK
jgi:hypothetical protein